jgi:hypothetical protein
VGKPESVSEKGFSGEDVFGVSVDEKGAVFGLFVLLEDGFFDGVGLAFVFELEG